MVVADELLTRIRSRLGAPVEYDEAPAQLDGGFFTANYRFSLKDGPQDWRGPLVLRLFPDHTPVELAGWEAAVQRFAHERGVPAPAVALYEPDVTIDGRRWFVMELLPGSPAMGGITVGELLRGLRWMARDMASHTAQVHLALHRLDPSDLAASFGEVGTIERWWSAIERPLISGRPHPLLPGVEWLRRNQPEPRAPLVLCHGDSWGGNILVDDRRVTGLIDWTVATVAEPALEVGFLTAAMSLAPLPLPRPVHRIAQRVSRRLGARYRATYEQGSDADLTAVPYYEALRCLLELDGVVRYRTSIASGVDYDSPRPPWDGIADLMVTFFEQRTGVRLEL